MTAPVIDAARAAAELHEAASVVRLVAERVAASRSALRSRVELARAAVEASRARLEVARATWTADLAAARTHIDELGAQSETALGELSSSTRDLTARATSVGALARALDSKNAERLGSVAERCNALEASLSENLDRATGTFESVNAATDELMEESEERVQSLEEKLSNWSSRTRGEMEGLLSAIATLRTNVRQRSDHLESHFSSMAGEKLSGVEQALLGRALSSLVESAGDVRQATGLLEATNGDGLAELKGAIEQVSSKAHSVLEVIRAVRPALEAARALL